jgi:hypothetical protein
MYSPRRSCVLAPDYLDFIPVTTVHPWTDDPLPDGWSMVKDEMTTRYYFKKYAPHLPAQEKERKMCIAYHMRMFQAVGIVSLHRRNKMCAK